MPLVSSIDYVNKRIYLSADTVGATIDTIDIYKEIRALRESTETHRNFKPLVAGGGNIQKTATSFTAPYVQLLHGCRIVPYDTSHDLTLIRDTFTDDGFSGSGCFDLSSLTSGVAVNIMVEVNLVEIKIVETGGSALTTQESTELNEARNAAVRLANLIEDVGGDRFTAKALEQGQSGSTVDKSVVSSTNNTTVIDVSESAIDSTYIGQILSITSGPGVGQTRVITEYIGSTKTVTLAEDWTTNPTNSSKYTIIPTAKTLISPTEKLVKKADIYPLM
jgi:hypothetical protein